MAGYLLGILLFDQPNVQGNNDSTARVLKIIQPTGRLPKQSTAAQLRRQCRPGTYIAILQDGTGHSLDLKSVRLPLPCDHDSWL